MLRCAKKHGLAAHALLQKEQLQSVAVLRTGRLSRVWASVFSRTAQRTLRPPLAAAADAGCRRLSAASSCAGRCTRRSGPAPGSR